MTTRSWPKLAATESWATRSVAERAAAIESACRTAIQILSSSPDPAKRLAEVDPVPASTQAHVRRLARR